MQTTVAPSGDSRSISISAAAPRRGRPRIHANESAKKAAYRQRIYERKLAAKRRAKVRAAIRRLRSDSLQRDFLSEARDAYQSGDPTLALSLFEQHEAQQATAEYDEQTEREKKRAAKPVKHNRACRGKNACLCGLTMSRGSFLVDAPRGRGLLVSGGYGPEEIALINNHQQMKEERGSRASASGWGSDRDEKIHYENRDEEAEHTFSEKHFRDSSWLRCYVPGCKRLVWGVLPGDGRYHCDLHAPVVGE